MFQSISLHYPYLSIILQKAISAKVLNDTFLSK